jgi:bifunctional DNA-binding transcriptional regulator/antitoxin component of YhaV-PrlF toxin-antitoxin module
MSEGTVISWDRPVQKKGQVTLPKKILEALGNPDFVRFEVKESMFILKRVEKEATDDNANL